MFTLLFQEIFTELLPRNPLKCFGKKCTEIFFSRNRTRIPTSFDPRLFQKNSTKIPLGFIGENLLRTFQRIPQIRPCIHYCVSFSRISSKDYYYSSSKYFSMNFSRNLMISIKVYLKFHTSQRTARFFPEKFPNVPSNYVKGFRPMYFKKVPSENHAGYYPEFLSIHFFNHSNNLIKNSSKISSTVQFFQ